MSTDHFSCNKCSLLIVYIVVLLSMICSSNGKDDHESVSKHKLSKRSVRFCGVKLVNTMKMICNHCYQPPKTRSPKKRSKWYSDSD